MEDRTWKTLTEAEKLEEIDKLHLEYRKKKQEAQLRLLEMRKIRKQIDLVEDALIIHTLERWQSSAVKEVL